MKLSKEVVWALPEHQFSRSEKAYLVEKLFPSAPREDWKKSLEIDWQNDKRWGMYLGRTEDAEPRGTRYWCTPEMIAARGKLQPPRALGRTVTDFTGWIYSLYRPPAERALLETGKHVERELARNYVPVPGRAGWDIICNGMDQRKSEPLRASSLTINGMPLLGLPDLVFREAKTGRVVIVEIKASNREIPVDGWPNLRSQLWAYGKMDVFSSAPSILLVAEIWGFSSAGIYLRRVVRWSASDIGFEKQNSELFELYRSISTSEV